jgi:tetratricopeptide (TPR) repeat protein
VAIGDLQAAEPLISNPKLPADRRATYALFHRNYVAAVEILSKELAMQRDPRDPEDLLILAFSQHLAGKLSAASATYQKALENFRRELEKAAPGPIVEADTHTHLAAANAGLGKAESAIAEGQRAMALAPSSRYPDFGPNVEDEMARTYARLGDAGHAIPMLKRLLQTSYGGATFLTPATLRLDPIWDAIRSDPRFQQLAAEKVPLPEKRAAAVMTKPQGRR